MKRLLKSVLFWSSFWFGGALVVSFLMTHRIWPGYDEPLPEIRWGVPVSERIKTADGEELGAWFIGNESDPKAPAVILLHGIYDCRRQLLYVAEELHRRGSPCLLVTQRGHGDSTGSRIDFGYSCRRDVTAAVDWLRAKEPDRPIVVWGTSMGAASALFAAEDNGQKVAGYILESPYQNLHVATRNRTKLVLPRGVEWAAYRTLHFVGQLWIPDVDAIDPASAGAKMPAEIPVLILAGANDRLATPDEAIAIGDKLGDRAEVVIAPSGGHTMLLLTDRDLIRREVHEFLDSLKR